MSMQMKGAALNVKRATTWRASQARSVVDETPAVHANRPPPPVRGGCRRSWHRRLVDRLYEALTWPAGELSPVGAVLG